MNKEKPFDWLKKPVAKANKEYTKLGSKLFKLKEVKQ